ncbi:MAG: hypothetical protein ACK5TH_23830 [Prosthecobacter sp.]|jgi:hypothetical protein
MSSRLLTFAITAAVLLAGSLVALKEGWLNGWKMKVTELVSQSGPPYTEARFRIDLVDQINYARTADKMSALRVDPEMEKWLSSKFESMDLADLNKVTSQVQDGMPRYFRVSVCAASSPSLKELLQRFHEYVHRDQPEMTHLAVAVRPRAAGIMHEALVVIGQRLNDFTPEALTHAKENTPFFSVCVHCKQPHFMSLSNQQRSMALECPKCRKKYAVIAADSKGRFRYVNEFLTGYSPPAVFPKNESRVQQLFTIWSAVHTNCRYTNDPGVKKSEGMYAKKEQLDSWQFADETQRLLRGDCEDSSIYLADWLMSRGFQVRVALGRYGDMGGHAWCVVKIEDREYLIESTEGKPDPSNPPLASQVGSRYVPEVLFDRYAIYVPASSNRVWKGDYWSAKSWVRIEPRTELGHDPLLSRGTEDEKTKAKSLVQASSAAEASRVGRATDSATAVPTATNLGLGDIPRGAKEWRISRVPEHE